MPISVPVDVGDECRTHRAFPRTDYNLLDGVTITGGDTGRCRYGVLSVAHIKVRTDKHYARPVIRS